MVIKCPSYYCPYCRKKQSITLDINNNDTWHKIECCSCEGVFGVADYNNYPNILGLKIGNIR
jgi:hypothetical protein